MNLKEENSSEILTTRRGLLKGLFTFLGALGLGSILYGLYGFLARGEGAYSSVEVSLNKIPLGGAYLFQFGESPAILVHEEEGVIEAFSLVCTHLGCTVRWNAEKKEFHCPCHDGLFDAHGIVLSGPPPSPLERWKVKVDGEKVFVG
jgi:cytochrome b6-f complex iron-sulfur subunit